MNYRKIYKAIIKVFKDSSVNTFPLNCLELFSLYGYGCIPFGSLPPAKREACLQISQDAFLLKGNIYYNNCLLPNRQRFSLMHELGHITLEHMENPVDYCEQEANAFASHILAPRIIMHFSGFRNEGDVAEAFQLTAEAAHYACEDYRRWLRYRAYYHLEALDQAVYRQFYDTRKQRLIWRRERCIYTGGPCINRVGSCYTCRQVEGVPDEPDVKSAGTSRLYFDPFFLPEGFERAEYNYLYGDDY